MKYPELLHSIPLIEKKIEYCFKDHALLATAFVHRSFLNENKELQLEHNERLEFLGDSVLNLLVAENLYQSMPQTPEGELSVIRAHAVSSGSCVKYMDAIELSPFVLVGKGEEMQAQVKGSGRTSILSDAFEALLGAIYLDGGMECAKYFFFSHFLNLIKEMTKKPSRNFKARLQEHIQKKEHVVPEYRVLEEKGPDHNRFFLIGVFVHNTLLGKGCGMSKKQAEQQAAEEAIKKLGGV